jgi:branched-chain amino acid transport system permease protein
MAYVIRSVVAVIPGWGTQQKSLKTPFDNVLVNVGAFDGGWDTQPVRKTHVFFQFTNMGIAMRATAQNASAAHLMGVPVPFIYALIWGVSAGVATVAGLLVAPITLIDSSMSNLGLRAFPAAVLGGFGSLPGAVLGGVLIGTAETFSGFWLPEGFKDAVPFVILLVVLMFRPAGILGSSARRKV